MDEQEVSIKRKLTVFYFITLMVPCFNISPRFITPGLITPCFITSCLSLHVLSLHVLSLQSMFYHMPTVCGTLNEFVVIQ